MLTLVQYQPTLHQGQGEINLESLLIALACELLSTLEQFSLN